MKAKKANYPLSGIMNWGDVKYSCCLCKKEIETNSMVFVGYDEYQCQECFDILKNLGKNNE